MVGWVGLVVDGRCGEPGMWIRISLCDSLPFIWQTVNIRVDGPASFSCYLSIS